MKTLIIFLLCLNAAKLLNAAQTTMLVQDYTDPIGGFTPYVVTNGLMAYWKLDLTNANATTPDASGNGNNGTNTVILLTSGIVSNGFSFNGSNSLVNCGVGSTIANLAKTSAGTPASWSFWIKPTTTVSGTILARNDGNTIDHGWWIIFDSVGSVQLVLERSDVNKKNSVVGIATNVWTHVVFTQSGNAANPTVTAYTNGISASFTNIISGDGVSATDITNSFIIGRWGGGAGGGNGFYKGSIDEVGIFNVVLDATSVSQIYSNAIAGFGINGTP